jgi:protein gp37
MSANTKIEWADHTFNPWIGCTKVGAGCDNCYAKADFEDRKHRVVWGAGQARSRTSAANWKLPIKWNAKAALMESAWQYGIKVIGNDEQVLIDVGFIKPTRPKVFCASLADVFDNEVDPMWRADLFWLIKQTPNLDWLLLTKRIGNARTMMADAIATIDPMAEWVMPLPNIWLGTTIVNQEEADRDIPKLLALPAAKRFLSMEPLLGPVDLTYIGRDGYDGHYPLRREDNADGAGIDWIIVGGESGPNARPMHPDWVRSVRDQCQAAGVPFLFKQWGEWTPGENVERVRGTVDTAFFCSDGWRIYPLNLATDGGHVDDQPDLYQVGKKAAGRHLDGTTWDEVPA